MPLSASQWMVLVVWALIVWGVRWFIREVRAIEDGSCEIVNCSGAAAYQWEHPSGSHVVDVCRKCMEELVAVKGGSFAPTP